MIVSTYLVWSTFEKGRKAHAGDGRRILVSESRILREKVLVSSCMQEMGGEN